MSGRERRKNDKRIEREKGGEGDKRRDKVVCAWAGTEEEPNEMAVSRQCAVIKGSMHESVDGINSVQVRATAHPLLHSPTPLPLHLPSHLEITPPTYALLVFQ